jgi:hypothetical protein
MDVYGDRGPEVPLSFVGERSDKRLSWPVGANRPFRLMGVQACPPGERPNPGSATRKQPTSRGNLVLTVQS